MLRYDSAIVLNQRRVTFDVIAEKPSQIDNVYSVVIAVEKCESNGECI